MKYIMFKLVLTSTNEEALFPVVFPDFLIHAEVAYATAAQVSVKGVKVEVASAGFISFEDKSCFGKSESLSKESNPEDFLRIVNFKDYKTKMFLSIV